MCGKSFSKAEQTRREIHVRSNTYRWSELNQCVLTSATIPSASTNGAMLLKVFWYNKTNLLYFPGKGRHTGEVTFWTVYPASLSDAKIIIMKMQNQTRQGRMHLTEVNSVNNCILNWWRWKSRIMPCDIELNQERKKSVISNMITVRRLYLKTS